MLVRDHRKLFAANFFLHVLNSIKTQRCDNVRAIVSHASYPSYPDIYLILAFTWLMDHKFSQLFDIDIDWMIDILLSPISINVVHIGF